jgi:histone H3/H4
MAKLPLAPFEKILKESKKGIRVSDTATKEFVELINEISKAFAADAAELAEHAGRRTILDSDVKLAGKRKR